MVSVLMSMVICRVSLGSESEKILALTASHVRLDEGVAKAAFVEIRRQSASTDPDDARRRIEAGGSGHAPDDLFHSASPSSSSSPEPVSVTALPSRADSRSSRREPWRPQEPPDFRRER